MAAATITEISESSDLVWEMLCRYEDGEPWTRAEYAQLSEGDRKILSEEIQDMTRKSCAAQEREVASSKMMAQAYATPKMPPMPWERGESARDRALADYYENRILARQECEEDHNMIGFA